MRLFRFSILYVFLCVSLDYFIPVLLAFNVLGLVLQYQAKRLVGKNVFKLTYFASSGTLNLNSINKSTHCHQSCYYLIAVYQFLLVIFGNNVTILHHFRVTVTYSVCGCLRP